eukprot:TRINITY_DN19554_c0_g1_i1.p1 TRINITY_DN19554_c0_g1~~TRINITY_DN19554_c0_g1_i1.p1  ORF type:complete len:442 (+),score=55.51 TRINITY_DN19554_c0_g1_i1:451-1776(+)
MESKQRVEQAVFRCPASISCSVCLEPVSDRGERSIAKLKCGHHFHLDCIGSAFNAKGAMQCPNCRHVEHGQWLYANGCRPYEDFTIEDFPDDDYLYNLHHPERSLGFPWCPYQGAFSQLSLSFEDVEPPSSASSSGTRVCPYLAVHGLSRMRQIPLSMSNAGSSNNMGDAGDRQQSSVSDINRYSSHPISATEIPHPQWSSSSAFATGNNVVTVNEPTLSVVSSHDRYGMTRADSERVQLNHPGMPPNYVATGYYSRPVSGRPLTSELVHSQNHIHGHGGPPVYRASSSAASSLQSTSIGHTRWLRSHDSMVTSDRFIQPVMNANDQTRIQGSSSYPLNRAHEGENIGWHPRNPVYGLQREGFPAVSWVPLDQDSQAQHWAWFPRGQNRQNINHDPINRSFYRHNNYFNAEGAGTQGHSGSVPLETSYPHHGYARFPSFYQ